MVYKNAAYNLVEKSMEMAVGKKGTHCLNNLIFFKFFSLFHPFPQLASFVKISLSNDQMRLLSEQDGFHWRIITTTGPKPPGYFKSCGIIESGSSFYLFLMQCSNMHIFILLISM